MVSSRDGALIVTCDNFQVIFKFNTYFRNLFFQFLKNLQLLPLSLNLPLSSGSYMHEAISGTRTSTSSHDLTDAGQTPAFRILFIGNMAGFL